MKEKIEEELEGFIEMLEEEQPDKEDLEDFKVLIEEILLIVNSKLGL